MITGKELIALGFKPGKDFAKLIPRANELRGKDPEGWVDLLRNEYPDAPPKLHMRRLPLSYSEAIRPRTEIEEKNLTMVRGLMGELMRVPVVKGGTIMPDSCPAGSAAATIPVGGAIAVENAIIPGAHSADICCSVFATFFQETDTGSLMDALMTSTRFGQGGRQKNEFVEHPVLQEAVWSNPFLRQLELQAQAHMADQGDGNHFAYVGKITLDRESLLKLEKAGYEQFKSNLEQDKTYSVIVTHHGSRGLGAKVYGRGQKIAETMTGRIADAIPKAAAWIPADSEEGQHYWEALQYISRWTRANHESIHERTIKRLQINSILNFGNEHNFVWKEGTTFYHGKGATPAWKDGLGRPLLGLIPLNMASEILLVLGGDNRSFLSFAPHGAGRNQSRSQMLAPFKGLDTESIHAKIAELTSGLDIRWFSGKPDLSESPIGYKNASEIVEQIQEFGLADVVARITPCGCIMAGEQEVFWKSKKKAQ